MNLKKRLALLFSKPSSREETGHHKKHRGFWGQVKHSVSETLEEPPLNNHRRRKFLLLFGKALVIVFLLLSAVTAYAQAPDIQANIAKLIPAAKPKPVTKSSKVLSSGTQQAIETLAREEIKNEQSQALVETGLAATEQTATPLTVLQSAQETLEDLTTRDSSVKAKIKLARVNRKIDRLQQLFATNKSDKTIDQVLKLIQEIGQQTDEVTQTPVAHTDRNVLTIQIEQYNRLQLLIQKGEEALPLEAYLKVENARQKYLVETATQSINAAPNLEAVHNIGVAEVKEIVGADFAELKAIEVISDFKDRVQLEAQQKLSSLEKQLGLEFEKKMLKLPSEVRMRKLQNYIQLSYGNPVLQIQSFDAMKGYLTDREMILGVETLKELVLKKLENRIFEIDNRELRDQFIQTTFKTPNDLEVLAQVRMDVDAGADQVKKQHVADLEENAFTKLGTSFDTVEKLQAFYADEVKETTNIVDAASSSRLAVALEKSPAVSAEVKAEVKTLHKQILHNFVSGIRQKDFITKSKLAYNPVSENADVRLLLPVPRAMLLLEEIKTELPAQDKSVITTAQKANATLIANHVLSQVNDPILFDEYVQRIDTNPQVKQLLARYVGGRFFTNLDKKEVVMTAQAKVDQQALYEKMQQLVQHIFLTADNSVSSEEKNLPQVVVDEIQQLKNELAAREVPQLTVPEDVMLPDVAVLPSDVEQAIITAAKNKIKAEAQSADVKLDLQLEAKDLGIGEPTILPNNLLYPLKEAIRIIEIVTTLDPVTRAEKVLDQANEKTLEAAKLVEESSSPQTIELALKTLNDVSTTFDKLQEHTDDLLALQVKEPEKVDALVNQIIENGLARQTVLSSIEDKVTGSDYVAVEQIRQEVLKDGVGTLLTLSHNDAQTLVHKLETVVDQTQGSEFKEIKAVELLVEIERTQSQEVQQVLDAGQEKLAARLEDKLLAMPAEERTTKLLDYAESLPGNPVRQFETYEKLKDGFDNPETILLTEALKDKAVENLTERVSEITDANARQEFVDQVVGDRPEDLKIITEIQLRVETPSVIVGAELTPIEEKIADIKAAVEQNIIDTYKNDPQGLSQTELFSDPSHLQTPDLIDVKIIRELADTLERTPEVQPAVVTVVDTLETKITDQFIENVTSPNFGTTTVASLHENTTTQVQPDSISVGSEVQVNTDLATASAKAQVSVDAIQVFEPIPAVIEELIALKADLPARIDAKIDKAIAVQVDLIQEHLTTQVNDPQTFQTYVAQITENPIVAEAVTQNGGSSFIQAVEAKAQEIQTTATTDQTILETTVAQVQKEIFSAPVNNPSLVEQSLPEVIQEQIQQVKQEVPVEQVPQVTVTAAVTVTTTIEQPVQQPIAPAPTAPAPVAPSTPEPVSAPPVAAPPAEAPAAPAVGL